MSSTFLSRFSRSAPIVTRSLYERGQVVAPVLTRTYATKDGSSPGQTSNVSNPQASSAESQSINKSASVGRTDKNDADHVSTANPVSKPEEGRLGATEETTESQDKMKHDPKESDKEKREKTLEYGQNKPLDAADK
ncbi:hypothetical protein IAQ61_000260 [Plenodomus lingam]|uniref:Uncharacterized protein n=1 Tax=Leptosphaeria maculans (strain JN3 / isolate v23.1.3 / race Av1-4-5-6-7-8) TaxID=985895 RepID=E5R5A0_LEPMJ|nr:hypothetical protein LEMA_P047760.1 [Plenodomus lingam JN3]KAH9881534.1 hypothetical protein IAQ61_000260 [Plenodomus lingam]CBX92070.1 hypothetical protein LEMA_P047760.1 [Plenodomus lingam JN3]